MSKQQHQQLINMGLMHSISDLLEHMRLGKSLCLNLLTQRMRETNLRQGFSKEKRRQQLTIDPK